MDNNSNKNIFNHIKSKFEDPSKTKESWNTPPDFVFEEAIDKVNSRKKNNKRRYYIGLLCFFLLGSIYTTHIYFNNKIDTLESKMSILSNKLQANDLENNIQSKNQEDNVNQNSDRNTVLTKNGTVSPQNKNSRSKEQSNTATGNEPPRIQTSYNSKNQNKSIRTSHSQSIKNESIQKITNQVNYSKIDQENHPKNSLDYVAPIASIPLKHPYSSGGELQLTVPFALTAVNAESNKLFLLEAGIVGNASSFCMQGSLPNESLLTGYDKYYSGTGLYIATNIPVANRWFMRSTFQASLINNESHLVGSIPYNNSN